MERPKAKKKTVQYIHKVTLFLFKKKQNKKTSSEK